ncbi:MAG: VPS10 domain-containing protein [Omnitrophica WOR_2 bacterium]
MNDYSLEAIDPVYTILTTIDENGWELCFAARQSGFFLSKDGGIHWQTGFQSLQLDSPLSVTAAAISPSFRSDHTLFCGVPGGILYTIDGTKSWSSAIFQTPPPVISCIALSPDYLEDGILFAGTLEDGIFRSADRGSRWSPWNFGLLDLSILSLAISPGFKQDETILAGTSSGVFISENGGRAWREMDFPVDYAPVLCLALSPDYPQSGTIFAGTESRGLYQSTDNGDTWQRLGEEAIPDTVNNILLSQNFLRLPEILILTADSLQFSRDRGITWNTWKQNLVFDQNPTAMAALSGLHENMALLIGFEDGQIMRI